MDVPWRVDYQGIEVGRPRRSVNELGEVEALQVAVDPLSPATVAQAVDAELSLMGEVDLQWFEFRPGLALGFSLARVRLRSLHLAE